MTSEETGPRWMVELEAKLKLIKQKRQLGHEFGAGSPCNICNEKCPGLDLHFWRKRCLACKCHKEDHDVPPDDGDMRFEILLNKECAKPKTEVLLIRGLPSHYRNVVIRQFIHKMSPVAVRKIKFDWVPPNVTKELAAEYMEQLPTRKTPMTGSEGARYRKKQLERQIPLYDISHFDTSQKLGPEGQLKFLEYLQNVRKNVVGQARIQKLCLKQFVEKSQPYEGMPQSQHSEIIAKTVENMPRTGGGDFKALPVLKLRSSLLPSTTVSQLQPPASVYEVAPPAPINDDSLITNINKMKIKNDMFGLDNKDSNNLTSSYPVNPTVDANLANAQETDVNEGLGVDVLLNNMPPNPMYSAQVDNETINFNNLDPHNLENATEQTVNSSSNVDEVLNNTVTPVVPTDYDFNCQPGFDSHPTGYKPAPNKNQDNSQFEQNEIAYVHGFNTTRGAHMPPEHVLSVESTMCCAHCEREIRLGSVAVVTDRAGTEVAWHPECFVCNVCKELLVDLIYFFYEGKVFCGRHYAEKMKIPRCYACDELIFVQEYTLAEGKSYHVNHYCCMDCDKELAGNSYLSFGGQIICLDCYNTKYSKPCQTCNGKILASEEGVNFSGHHWHATPDCYKCAICGISLQGKKMSIKKGNALCSSECIVKFNAFNA